MKQLKNKWYCKICKKLEKLCKCPRDKNNFTPWRTTYTKDKTVIVRFRVNKKQVKRLDYLAKFKKMTRTEYLRYKLDGVLNE